MRIALFLPHVGVYGGVRRFIELGNAWRASGHEVSLFHPDGTPPAWLPFRGRVRTLAEADDSASDLAVCGDSQTLEAFQCHRSDLHLYYCVLERDPGLTRAARDPDILLAANSSPLRDQVARRWRRPVLDGIGGIDLTRFRPDPSRRDTGRLRILLNGRRARRKKGTDIALAAVRGLHHSDRALEVVLFDSPDPRDRDPRDGAKLPPHARYVLDPSQEELVALYQSADIFVAAERKAGWCNTAIEAMACGTAVVCTTSGTADFAVHERNALIVPVRHAFFIRRAVRRLLEDQGLRQRLANAGPVAAAPWSWRRLAERLLAQLPLARSLLSSSAPIS